MRTEVRYPYQDVVDEAVSQTREAFISAGLAGFSAPADSTPPQIATTAGTDSQGHAITLFPAMTEMDSTETGACTC